MSHTHTPGEWFASSTSAGRTIFIDCRLRGTTLQEIAAIGPTEKWEQQAGNALLIAAAPDLLEQLVYLQDCIETGKEPAMSGPNAAIRKAQGKAA
jgi:hypothetical protein